MKILLVHNFYQQHGGEDAAALADESLLQDNGHEVILYTRHNEEIRANKWSDHVLLAPSMIHSRQTVRDIQELILTNRPDVAYIHNTFPLISPSIYHVLHSLGIPTVQVMHDFRFFCPNGWFYIQNHVCEKCKGGNYFHAVRNRCYRESYLASLLSASIVAGARYGGGLDKISAFLCPTEFSRKKLLEAGIPGDRIFVRPHFFDGSSVVPRPGAGSYVLYLGRLSSEKGIWTLLRTFEQLRHVNLKVVGTGPLEHELRRYVEERDLENVEIVGFKSGEEKWDLILKCSFAVVPSECYETFCLVVLESYAAGKPVVGSRLGSLPYLIDDGETGLLFEPGSTDELKEKITSLLARPIEIEEMGRRARNLLLTRYRAENSYGVLMDVFSVVTHPKFARRDGAEKAETPGSSSHGAK